tara:strand:- start:182 stop:337 length:156 start_codon:yes stop_codon:yes gene_type:complete
MKTILNIIEQVEKGKITSDESIKLIKEIVIEQQDDELLDDELLDYVFPTKK